MKYTKIITVVGSVVCVAVIIPLLLNWREDARVSRDKSIEQQITLQIQTESVKEVRESVRDLTDVVTLLVGDRVINLRERITQLEMFSGGGPYFSENEAKEEIEKIRVRLRQIERLTAMGNRSKRNTEISDILNEISGQVLVLENNYSSPDELIQKQINTYVPAKK